MHIKCERSCIACRQKKQQNELLRITKIDNNFYLDKNQNMGGRGAYICKQNSCIQQVIKKHLLNKAYKMNINSDVYNMLEGYEQNN